MATAFSVTPAQATKASSSMSPEQSSSPEPPVAGCKPAMAIALPVLTLQATDWSSIEPLALSVTRAGKRHRDRPPSAAPAWLSIPWSPSLFLFLFRDRQQAWPADQARPANRRKIGRLLRQRKPTTGVALYRLSTV